MRIESPFISNLLPSVLVVFFLAFGTATQTEADEVIAFHGTLTSFDEPGLMTISEFETNLGELTVTQPFVDFFFWPPFNPGASGGAVGMFIIITEDEWDFGNEDVLFVNSEVLISSLASWFRGGDGGGIGGTCEATSSGLITGGGGAFDGASGVAHITTHLGDCGDPDAPVWGSVAGRIVIPD